MSVLNSHLVKGTLKAILKPSGLAYPYRVLFQARNYITLREITLGVSAGVSRQNLEIIF